MIINTNGKIFGKISIVDVLIIVIVLLSIVGIGYKFIQSKTATFFNKADNLSIVLYVEEVPEYAAKSVKLNDLVSDFETGSAFGNVTKIDIGPSVNYTADDKGEIKKSSKQGYSSAYITTHGLGFYKDGVTESGISIDGIDYFIGRSITFSAGNSIMYGRVYDIKKDEK